MYLCESERSCICVLKVTMLSLSTILISDFGIVSTVWYFHFIKTLTTKKNQLLDMSIVQLST